MKFKMNDLKWTIKFVSADDIKSAYDENDGSYIFGLTTFSRQEILINNEVSIEKQKQTLYHELLHCYLYCYTDNREQFNEENICDISAKSHDMIHGIVEKCFK